MKKMMLTISLVATLGSSLVFAPQAQAAEGSKCHFHGNKPAAQAVVSDCATQRRDALVKSGKLDASWQAVKPEKIEVIDGKKGKEWKLTFNNPAVVDKTKSSLFMFFTETGNFMAANFTGK